MSKAKIEEEAVEEVVEEPSASELKAGAREEAAAARHTEAQAATDKRTAEAHARGLAAAAAAKAKREARGYFR